MFSNKDLKNLILPLIVEQLLAVTIGIADTVMVSSCGEAAVSGISLVDSINILLITVFSSLATGGAVIAAQYLGKGEPHNASKAAKQLEYLVLGISILLMGLAVAFRNVTLSAIFGAIEPDVMSNAQIYFLLSALSYPALAVYNAGAALFRSMGDSRTSMLISILMNAINVGGNALLIFGFGMGVAGAAAASLVSRIVGAVIITVLLLNRDRKIHLDEIRKFEWKPDMIKKILRIGVPNGLENSIFQIGKILVASVVAGFGTVAITANAIAGNLASIQIIPGQAIGMAMLTVVGQCIGARDYDGVKKYVKKLMAVTYLATWAVTLFMVLFSRNIVSFYSLSGESASLTLEVFMVHAVCCAVIWPPAFALPNALRAASDVKFTMLVSLFSMWIFRIGFSYVLALYFQMGVVGIWVAMCIDWLCRAVFFVFRFLSGKWKKAGSV